MNIVKGFVANKEVIFEIDSIAKQANGVIVRCGNTSVLCTAVVGQKVCTDFVPLSVHYIERFSAVNKIPGGYKKREAQPNDGEILSARIIDRALRASITASSHEVQVFVQVLSYDGYATEVLGIAGASVALNLAGVTNKLVSAARITDKFINQVSKKSAIDFIQAICDEKIVMAEATSGCIDSIQDSIESLLQYQKKANFAAQQMFGIQDVIVKKYVPTIKVSKSCSFSWNFRLRRYAKKILAAMEQKDIKVRQDTIEHLKTRSLKYLDLGAKIQAKNKLYTYLKQFYAKKLSNGIRLDGRSFDQIRYISMHNNCIPSLHGSALFTRGITQAMVSVTLGDAANAQYVDSLEGTYKDYFLVQYNFMPYATAQVGKHLAVSRREIGHGQLARRALQAVMPERLDNTIRVFSEITSCDGSSSMATICAASLALKQAGVDIKEYVAGISVGAFSYQNKTVLISDMTADEDWFSEMDFKIAGTNNSITAIQLDAKNGGIDLQIFEKALEFAHTHIRKIIYKMNKIEQPHFEKLVLQKKSIYVEAEKTGAIIGRSGVVINELSSRFDVKIDVDRSGTVTIIAKNHDAMEKTIAAIMEIVE